MKQIVQTRTYYCIFGALMALTATTVGVAYINLGMMNTWMALIIAACKATLVILFFMHLKYGSRLTWLFLGASIFWLALLLILSMSDYLARSHMPVTASESIYRRIE